MMNHTIISSTIFLLLTSFLFFTPPTIAETDSNCANGNDDGSTADIPTTDDHPPPPCWLYLAESTIPDHFGVFSAIPLQRGTPIGNPEIVIQLIDYLREETLLWDRLRKGEETGGQYEARTVHSVLPGVGMTANGHPRKPNALAFRPEVDEADLPRTNQPGAGAITHYHNLTFYATTGMEPGQEVFTRHEKKWWKEELPETTTEDSSHRRSMEYLREHGMCMDHLKPKRSKIRSAGRGAFAGRFLRKDDVIAPAPLIPISRESLDMSRRVKDGKVIEGKQLLLNYCFGHSNSSFVFYPYGSVVNLINHNSKSPNAILRWKIVGEENWTSSSSPDEFISLEDLKTKPFTGLVLEIVATRYILPNEEITIDYGKEWEEAWKEHKKEWKAPPFAEQYAPAYVFDDVMSQLRTESELREFPYEENIITTCFYKYSVAEHPNDAKSNEITTVEWKMSKGLFQYPNLRPCRILSRTKDKKKKKKNFYTAMMLNKYGMRHEERIPKGQKHIVTKIPRQAIRIMDVKYTTDQHLQNTFRMEIGIGDDIFPKAWMDMMEVTN